MTDIPNNPLDLIFTAIDSHKRTRAAHVVGLADAEMRCDDRLSRADSDAEISAWDKLIVTVPTTLAGLAAMLAYVNEWQGEDDGQYAAARDLLTAIRSAATSAKTLANRQSANV
jgi:hypothetical protein